MSLTNLTTKTPYAGNGVTTVFPFTFKVFQAADLVVTETTAAGVTTTLVLNTDYTVTGVGLDAGGSITRLGATSPPPTGTVGLIRRVVALTQTADIRNQSAFYASVHEDVFDKLTMADQYLQDQITDINSEVGAGPVQSFNGRTGAVVPVSGDYPASLIPFTQAGTGAVPTTADAKFKQMVSVLDFGAKGDGVTDDTAAIQLAFNSGAPRIIFPAGTYKCSSGLTLPQNAEINFGTATLDFSGVSSTLAVALKYNGPALVSVPTLASTANAGDRSLSLASAPTLSNGDVIMIYDSTDFSYSGWRNYYRAGEMCVVDSVVSTTVNLKGPLYATYTMPNANLSIYKIPSSYLTMKGGVFVGNDTFVSELLEVDRCTNLDLSGGQFYHSSSQNIYISNCYNSRVYDITSKYYAAAGGTSYALAFGNCQNVLVSNYNGSSTRHALTFGGADMIGAIPNRNIGISGSIFETTSTSFGVSALNLHGNVEYVRISDNYADGIDLGGNFVEVSNNEVRSSSSLFYFAEMSGLSYKIQGNRGFFTGNAAGNTSRGIFIDIGGNSNAYGASSTPTGGQLVITNNEFEADTLDAATTVCRGIVFQPRGSAPADTRVLLTGNRVWMPSVLKSGGMYAIYMTSQTITSSAIQILLVELANNKINGGNIFIADAQRVILNENRVSNCQSGNAFQVSVLNSIVEALNTNYEVLLRGNESFECGQTPFYVSGGSTTPSPYRTVTMVGNVSINGSQQAGGTSANRSGVFANQITTFVFAGNYINTTSANQQRLRQFLNMGTSYETGNFVGGAGTDSLSITTQLGYAYIGSGSKQQGFWSIPLSNTVASAATITPSGMLFAVSGSTTISTINLPYTGFTGTITLIPTGKWSTSTSGNIAQAMAANIGQVINATYDGTKWQLSFLSAAFASVVAAAPTGTTSTTSVMMGLGLTVTPTRSGVLVISGSGQMANSTINDGATVQLYYGTGTAPVNGAAVTGTAIGTSQTHTSLVAADTGGWSFTVPVPNLTRGTTYWVDVALKAVTGGTATVTGVTVAAVEM